MSVHKLIFPGLFIGILSVVFLTSQLLASPGQMKKVDTQPVPAAVQSVGQPVTGCSISLSYPDSIQQWCSLITQYSAENGVDPNLVSAVMLNESAGQPDAYSRSGAVGLMQVMPRDGKASTFVCKNGPCFATRPSMQELFDPAFNVSYGTRMLSELIQHYGDVREALKAYGPKDVGYYYADLVLGTLSDHR